MLLTVPAAVLGSALILCIQAVSQDPFYEVLSSAQDTFTGNFCITAPQDLYGWKLKLNFDQPVLSMRIRRAAVRGQSADSLLYHVGDEVWNARWLTGQRHCFDFLALAPGLQSGPQLTNLHFVGVKEATGCQYQIPGQQFTMNITKHWKNGISGFFCLSVPRDFNGDWKIRVEFEEIVQRITSTMAEAYDANSRMHWVMVPSSQNAQLIEGDNFCPDFTAFTRRMITPCIRAFFAEADGLTPIASSSYWPTTSTVNPAPPVTSTATVAVSTSQSATSRTPTTLPGTSQASSTKPVTSTPTTATATSTTTNQSTTTQVQISAPSCEGRAEGAMFRLQGDCSATYYWCIRGQPVKTSCGPGTVFNDVGLYCDWPYNVGCGHNQTPSPVTSAPSTQTPVTSVPSTQSPVTSAPSTTQRPTTGGGDGNGAPSCEGRAEGAMFRLPGDCSATYYWCIRGQPVKTSCGPGTVFNDVGLYCDWPYNVGCGDNQTPSPGTSASSTLAPVTSATSTQSPVTSAPSTTQKPTTGLLTTGGGNGNSGWGGVYTELSLWDAGVNGLLCLDHSLTITCGWEVDIRFDPAVTRLDIWKGKTSGNPVNDGNANIYHVINHSWSANVPDNPYCLDFNAFKSYNTGPQVTGRFTRICSSNQWDDVTGASRAATPAPTTTTTHPPQQSSTSKQQTTVPTATPSHNTSSPVVTGKTNPEMLDLYRATFAGDGTYYGEGRDGTCTYDNTHFPAVGLSNQIDALAALNYIKWFNSKACGMCFKGGCSLPGSVDFAQNGDGRWDIEIQAVQCPVGNNKLQYAFQGSNPWYIKLQVSNYRIPPNEVWIERNGVWTELSKTPDGYWVLGDGVEMTNTRNIPVRVTAINGEQLTDTIPQLVNSVVMNGGQDVQFALDPSLPSLP